MSTPSSSFPLGGKARNMHKHVRERKIKDEGKQILAGMLERGGLVRLSHVRQTNRETLWSLVRGNVDKGAQVSTDAHCGYRGLSREFRHGIVHHAVEYVSGVTHTNGLENLWILLKRTLSGAYGHSAFTATSTSERSATMSAKGNDADRFEILTGQVRGSPTAG